RDAGAGCAGGRHAARAVRDRRAVRPLGSRDDLVGHPAEPPPARRARTQRRMKAARATRPGPAGSTTGGAARQAREADTLRFLAGLSQALAVSLDLRQTLPEIVN